jgi:GNAT superfamily N-acetyltransferase
LRDDDRPGAVVALARAFQSDPLLCHLMPNPLRRARASLTFIGSVLADAFSFGEVSVVYKEGATAGVAAWLPPGTYPRGMWRSAVSTVRELGSAHRIGRRALSGARLYAAIDRAHAEVCEPHWYLAALGSDPAWQRRGVGSALLTPVLERADATGVRCYLETGNEDNVPWYRRQGFEVLSEVAVQRGPTIWSMHRLPQ